MVKLEVPNTKTSKITAFLGVNESPDGDINLKPGEASTMRNCKITNKYALQKRPGTVNAANLLSAYSVAASGTPQVVRTDISVPTTFTAYPNTSVSGGGLISLTGTPVTMTYANHNTYTNYYWQDTSGETFKFLDVTLTQSTGAGTHVTGGTVSMGDAVATGVYSVSQAETGLYTPAYFYSAVKVVNGVVEYDGTSALKGFDDRDISTYKYYKHGSTMYEMTSASGYQTVLVSYVNGHTVGYWYNYIEWTGKIVTATGNDTYAWSFYPVVIAPNATAAPVQGIWSGKVDGENRIVAACDSKLWQLMYNKVPNMIDNSDYAAGTTEWTAVTSNISTASGVMTITATAQYGDIHQVTPTIIKGHKYYYRASVQASSSSVGLIAADYVAVVHTSDYHTGSSGYETLSDLYTIPSNATTANWFFGVRDERTSGWNAVNVKEYALVDLTAIFGAGIEPTQLWCDTYLEYNGDTLTITDTTISMWVKDEIGAITTTDSVHMFGFEDKVYIQNGIKYYSWDGQTYAEVTGYAPIIYRGCAPSTGSGTTLEQVNKLTGQRRAWYTNTSTNKTFKIPVSGTLASVDAVKNMVTGAYYTLTTDYTVDATAKTVTLTAGTAAPGLDPDSTEITWTETENDRATVEGMRFSETFSGATDAYVFLYGDGSNMAIFSGVEYETGLPSAEYFPDLNVMHVDEANEAITAMIRHYSQLLTFKESAAFRSEFVVEVLSDGSTATGLTTVPVNRSLGNKSIGQAQLVNNNPLTLFGKSIYEWTNPSNNNERSAQPISARVSETLATFDFAETVTFDDEYNTEYYACYNGTAVVLNYTNNTWYIYTAFPATCFTSLDGVLYYGTDDGFVRQVDKTYLSDCGEAIDCYAEGGADDQGSSHIIKSSSQTWITIIDEKGGEVTYAAEVAGVQTTAQTVSATGNTGVPLTIRKKVKPPKYTHYKWVLASNTADTKFTVLGLETEVMPIKEVK